jgi:hypothetical protein
MSIKNKKTQKFQVGDLVTRTYKARQEPHVGERLPVPYGIVMEVRESTKNMVYPNVLVYWFKDVSVYTHPARINNSRYLRLVNRA